MFVFRSARGGYGQPAEKKARRGAMRAHGPRAVRGRRTGCTTPAPAVRRGAGEAHREELGDAAEGDAERIERESWEGDTCARACCGMPDAPVAALMQMLNGTNLTAAANDFYNDVMGFTHAVNWSERWLVGLGCFHAFVWLVALATRRNHDVQAVMLVLILGLVYAAEWINSLGSEHWQAFAGQNYFDKRGVFISVMYSAPLLCCAMFLLLNALRLTSSLLIQVKRREIRASQRKKAKAQ